MKEEGRLLQRTEASDLRRDLLEAEVESLEMQKIELGMMVDDLKREMRGLLNKRTELVL